MGQLDAIADLLNNQGAPSMASTRRSWSTSPVGQPQSTQFLNSINRCCTWCLGPPFGVLAHRGVSYRLGVALDY